MRKRGIPASTRQLFRLIDIIFKLYLSIITGSSSGSNNGLTLDLLRRNYHKLALKIHPDQNFNVSTDNKQLIQIAFITLNEAYENLVILVNKTVRKTQEFQECD